MKKILITIFGFLSIVSVAHASILGVQSGGTGASTLTGCLTGNGIQPITGTGVACGSGTITSGTIGQVPVYTAATTLGIPPSNGNIIGGFGSGHTGSTGLNNVCLGGDTLSALTSGSSNVCLGNNAGQSLTTGIGNLLLGLNAGESLTKGSNDAFILDDTSSTTISNFMDYGDTIFVTGIPNGGGMSAPYTGQVSINTTAPSGTSALTVAGTTTTSGLKISNLSSTVLAVDSSGNVISTTTSGGTNYFTNSGANTTLTTGINLVAPKYTYSTDSSLWNTSIQSGLPNTPSCSDGTSWALSYSTTPILYDDCVGEVTFAGSSAFFGIADRDGTSKSGGFYEDNGTFNVWDNLNSQNMISASNKNDSIVLGVTPYGTDASYYDSAVTILGSPNGQTDDLDVYSVNEAGYSIKANEASGIVEFPYGITQLGGNHVCDASGENCPYTGTVTSITAGAGLNGGTITTSGTISVATSSLGLATSTITFVTPSISGLITTSGCDSATSSVPTYVSSSTSAFVKSPETAPSTNVWFYSYLSSVGVVTTNMCADLTVTPIATKFVVKIIR